MHFIRQSNEYRLSPTGRLDLRDSLPPGNYTIRVDPRTEELYLIDAEPFRNPERLYGNVDAQAARILNTYRSRPGSTGVLLSGEKGSGKSLLAKTVAARSGLPVVIIDAPYCGDDFNHLVLSLGDCVILFEEWEKVYDETKSRQALLSLLDGAFSSRALFLLTVNDRYDIDRHMLNRPGRIYYHLQFTGLDEAFVRDYCAENLRGDADSVVRLVTLFPAFNFDMLQAVVEEMNRYDEDAVTVLSWLNIEQDRETQSRYTVRVFEGDAEVEVMPGYRHWTGNPFSTNRNINVETDRGDHYFGPADIVSLSHDRRTLTFRRDGLRFVLEREKERGLSLVSAYQMGDTWEST